MVAGCGTLCFGPYLQLPSPKGFCPTIHVPSITCGGGGDYPGQSCPVIEQQPKKKHARERTRTLFLAAFLPITPGICKRYAGPQGSWSRRRLARPQVHSRSPTETPGWMCLLSPRATWRQFQQVSPQVPFLGFTTGAPWEIHCLIPCHSVPTSKTKPVLDHEDLKVWNEKMLN